LQTLCQIKGTMQDDSKLRKLARDVLAGHRMVSELETLAGSRQSARTIFAGVAQEHYRQDSSGQACAACGSSGTEHTREYEWTAVIRRRVLKTVLLSGFLFPYIVACQFLPIYYVPELHPEADILNFKTSHRLCRRCHKRTRLFEVLRPFMQFLFGIPLVISFACLIGTVLWLLACSIGFWGCSQSWLTYSIPSFLGSLLLVSIFRFAMTRMQDILVTPAAIRNIERGGFWVSIMG
jgi:ribosomal protein L37E